MGLGEAIRREVVHQHAGGHPRNGCPHRTAAVGSVGTAWKPPNPPAQSTGARGYSGHPDEEIRQGMGSARPPFSPADLMSQVRHGNGHVARRGPVESQHGGIDVTRCHRQPTGAGDCTVNLHYGPGLLSVLPSAFARRPEGG